MKSLTNEETKTTYQFEDFLFEPVVGRPIVFPREEAGFVFRSSLVKSIEENQGTTRFVTNSGSVYLLRTLSISQQGD